MLTRRQVSITVSGANIQLSSPSSPPSPSLWLTVDHDDAGDSLVLLQPLQSLVQLGPARLQGGTVRRGITTDIGGLVASKEGQNNLKYWMYM